MTSRKKMTLVAFLQAQNCSNYPASWRHPDTSSHFLSAEYYQDIARILEAGKFHLAFFDDRLAMPDRYGDRADESVAHGVRAIKLDAATAVMVMGLATKHLGLGATYSTTYYEPFHVARLFATMDLFTSGRVAWNVVTSLNDSEAANFGSAKHLEHDQRYDRADEFLETVLGHWDTWADDALILDKASGAFADPAKVRRLEHKGKFFSSRGPFTVPRSQQGHPVLIQAGQSGRGKEFAARWGELIFTIYPNRDIAIRQYRDFKERLAAHGRDPDSVKVAPAIYTVVGKSRAEAEDRKALIDSLAKPIDTLALLSEVLNFDFSTKQEDEPFSNEELAAISGLQAVRDRVTQLSGKANPTLRDFAHYSGRGRLEEFPTFVGTGKDVADQLEDWFKSGACDGFVVAATHMPAAYADFVREVVPELQRRGLFREDYEGATLRENLGLKRPSAGDWRAEHR